MKSPYQRSPSFHIVLFGVLVLLSGCGTPAAPVAISPIAAPPNVANTPSPSPISLTRTPTPTVAPTPTTASSPIATFTAPPELTKPIFIQYGEFGGDGGNDFDVYLGRDTPMFVLYTDGQLILRKGQFYKEESVFFETKLSQAEMCSLLEHVKEAGFFKDIDPIYSIDRNQLGDGAGEIIIQINGELHKQVDIYDPGAPYLVKEISSTYRLLRDYQPIKALEFYKPSKVALWIHIASNSDSGQAKMQDWPTEFPPLADLWQDQTTPTVLVEGQFADAILQLYKHQMKFLYFRAGKVIYAIIARPLLPHERLQTISPWPTRSSSYPLPFSCPGSTKALSTSPTPTPP